MKKTFIGLSITLSILSANTTEFGISGGRSYVQSSPIENYNFLNLKIGKQVNKNSLLRGEIERSEKVLNNSNITRALLNYEHDFNVFSITPYYFLGGGYQWINKYKNSAVADIGLGMKFPLNEKIKLFSEIRYLRSFTKNDNYYSGIIGFSYCFGKKENQNNEIKKIIPIIKKSESDTDHDGVPDSLDKCPNTPSGISVNMYGCPLDSDKDGVPDYKDKCANTPVGIATDNTGCPKDEDHDGVPYYQDKCPNTPAGIKVDKYGCPVKFNLKIEFKNNSDKIEPQYMNTIKQFAEFLKQNPYYKVELQGYTDNTGNPVYNMVLSEKRAKAVYTQLIKLGIDKNRLSWVGYGPSSKGKIVTAKIYY